MAAAMGRGSRSRPARSVTFGIGRCSVRRGPRMRARSCVGGQVVQLTNASTDRCDGLRGEHALLTALVLFPSRGVMQCCQVFQRTKLRIFDCAPSNRGAMGCASSSPAEPAEAENNSKSCGINALDALGKPMAAQEQWDPDGSMEQGDHLMARRAAHAAKKPPSPPLKPFQPPSPPPLQEEEDPFAAVATMLQANVRGHLTRQRTRRSAAAWRRPMW